MQVQNAIRQGTKPIWVRNPKTGVLMACDARPRSAPRPPDSREFFLLGFHVAPTAAPQRLTAPQRKPNHKKWVAFGAEELSRWGMSREEVIMACRSYCTFSSQPPLMHPSMFRKIEAAASEKPSDARFYFTVPELREITGAGASKMFYVLTPIAKFQGRRAAAGSPVSHDERIIKGKHESLHIPWRLAEMIAEGKTEDEIMDRFCRDSEGKPEGYLPHNFARIMGDCNRGMNLRNASRKYGMSREDLLLYSKRAEEAALAQAIK